MFRLYLTLRKKLAGDKKTGSINMKTQAESTKKKVKVLPKKKSNTNKLT